MNKAERKKLADKVRRAAKQIEADHDYTCNALIGLQMKYATELAVLRVHAELFKPVGECHYDPWFGRSVLKEWMGGDEYQWVNNTENQDRRVVALCLLAAIIETEGV